MLEKIIKGVYKAKLLKARLCDVKIIVWGDGTPKTIEQISYKGINSLYTGPNITRVNNKCIITNKKNY